MFNNILPSYTSESIRFKIGKIAYLYTIWPILIFIRLVLVYSLVFLYNLLPLNKLFIYLLKIVCGASVKVTNGKEQKINIKNNRN